MKTQAVLVTRDSEQKFDGYINENLMQFIESVPDAMICRTQRAESLS